MVTENLLFAHVLFHLILTKAPEVAFSLIISILQIRKTLDNLLKVIQLGSRDLNPGSLNPQLRCLRPILHHHHSQSDTSSILLPQFQFCLFPFLHSQHHHMIPSLTVGTVIVTFNSDLPCCLKTSPSQIHI